MNKDAFEIQLKERIQTNFKMISSVIYHCMIELCDDLLSVKDYGSVKSKLSIHWFLSFNKFGNFTANLKIHNLYKDEPLAKKMFTKEEMAVLFETEKEFLVKVKDLLNSWLDIHAFLHFHRTKRKAVNL